MTKKSWKSAREKIDAEGRCRACGRSDRKLDAAHIWPRSMGGGQLADSVVPLCGPPGDPSTCHHQYDALRLDIQAKLTPEEQTEAVRAAGSIERARRRLLPSEYR